MIGHRFEHVVNVNEISLEEAMIILDKMTPMASHAETSYTPARARRHITWRSVYGYPVAWDGMVDGVPTRVKISMSHGVFGHLATAGKKAWVAEILPEDRVPTCGYEQKEYTVQRPATLA